MQSILTIIEQAKSLTGAPPIDIRQFLITIPSGPRSPNAKDESPEVPAIFVYLLNIFAKAIVAQFIDEAGVSPKAADPVGIVAASIFANNKLRWSGFSLIDILMCKFHVVCPVLWGIYGDEKTTQGKRSLGWWREEKDGPWVSDQRHAERMTGLGAGYAAITLRNFQKSNLTNPFPNYHYWRSFASIVNVPPAQASTTHFIVLKAMIENYEGRFLEFYGHAAIVALRKGLIDFPREAGHDTVAASALAVLPDVLKRDKKLTL
jgi:nucleoporin GLE1